jgi:hypothetical protein
MLTHRNALLDALRKSRVDLSAMMSTAKLTKSASQSSVVAPVIGASVSSLGILIIGVGLLIEGCGPPI